MPARKTFSCRAAVTALVLTAVLGTAAPVWADEDAGAYLSASNALRQYDFETAAGWFARALVTDPNNPALLQGAALANLGVGEVVPAANAARKMLSLEGAKSNVATLALVTSQAKTGDFEGVLKSLSNGNSAGPLLDDLLRAWAHLGAGRMSDALDGFDAVTATEGFEAFGLYHKALALASAGDFEGADDILSGRAKGTLSLMRRGIIARVEILSQLEKNPEAVTLLDQVFPVGRDKEIDALRLRLQAGEPLPLTIAAKPVDGMAEAFYSLSAALGDGEASEFPMIYARMASYLQPNHVEATLLTASFLDAQKQFAMAAQVYARVPADHPAFHTAEIGRAEATYADGRKDAAIEILQGLARSHGTLVDVQSALANALRREEKFAEAIVAYDAALALVPTPSREHWPVFYSRGICHERLGAFDAAETDMRKALELEPDQPQVLNYLGYSFVDRGVNLDEALGMIERAVAAQPDSGYIIDSLAWAYYRLGRYQDALAPMEQASLLEPIDPVVTDHLGDVYWAVGRTREAEFQWSRALSFGATEKDAARIREKLEKGLDAVLAAEGAAPLKPQDAAANGN